MIFEVGVGVLTVLSIGVFFIVRTNKRDKIDLDAKHIVITGGSSGIGWELCLDAFQQGAHVSIVARNLVSCRLFYTDSGTWCKGFTR
jgi:hypothetical protein